MSSETPSRHPPDDPADRRADKAAASSPPSSSPAPASGDQRQPHVDPVAEQPEESLLATQISDPESYVHLSSRRHQGTPPTASQPAASQPLPTGATSAEEKNIRSASAPHPSAGRSTEQSGSEQGEAAPAFIGPFRIVKELGAGAFGIVYMAEDESLQRRVAIKVPRVSDPKHAESYLNEARKAASIECEGIVPIYQVATHQGGVPYVVQKLIDGPNLRDLLKRYGAFPPADAVMLIYDIARALAIAHERGVYHRDLKPENVLIDSRGMPWIADFGLAISENEQVKQRGQIAGTLTYMSPEQIEGHVDWLDGRTDIWALGIMFYELLSGRPPFEGKTRQSLMQQICHRDPRPLHQRAPSLPRELNDIFLRCCAKRPSERFDSADALVAALEKVLALDLAGISVERQKSEFTETLSRFSTVRSGTRSSGLGSTLSSRESVAGEPSGAGGAVRNTGASADSFRSAEGEREVTPVSSADSCPSSGRTGGVLQRRVPVVAATAALVGIAFWWHRGNEPSRDFIAVPNSGNIAEAAPTGMPIDRTPAGIDEPTVSEVEREGPSVPEPPTEAATAPPSRPTIAADGSSALPWIVDGSGEGSHATVADAVAASKPLDVIHIRPGIYTEAVRVTHPLTIVAAGDRGETEIANDNESPLEIACDVGTVRLVGLTVRGDGRISGTQYNAISLTKGRLVLEQCDVRSRTWNCIHLSEGTSLTAEDCRFLQSDQFSVVAKSPANLTFDHCRFLYSGLQLIEAAAVIRDCEFLGREGIYVQQTGEQPVIAERCRFVGCGEYGIAASELGRIRADDCRFEGCEIGVLVYRTGDVSLDRGIWEECAQGIYVEDGGAAVEQGQFSGGRIGCKIQSGRLRLVNCRLSGMKEIGVEAKPRGDLELIGCQVNDCRDTGISMDGGTLNLTDIQIGGCSFGIYVSDDFTGGRWQKVLLENNSVSGAVLEAGEISVDELEVTGGNVGIVVAPPESGSVVLSLHNARFHGQTQAAGTFRGNSRANLKSIEPAEVPLSQLFQFDIEVQITADRN